MDDPRYDADPGPSHNNPANKRGRSAYRGMKPARGHANSSTERSRHLHQSADRSPHRNAHSNEGYSANDPGYQRGRGAFRGRNPTRGNTNSSLQRSRLQHQSVDRSSLHRAHFVEENQHIRGPNDYGTNSEGGPSYRWHQQRSSSSTSRQNSRGNRNHTPINWETKNAHRDGDQGGFNDNQRRRKQFMGFKGLEEIAKSDSKETLSKLMGSRNSFFELIQSRIDKFDVFILTMEIIAKVCTSSFDETKLKLLVDICNSNFIVSLKSYLMDLPYAESKQSNNLYWKDQEGFWRNFVSFSECVVNTSPSLALDKCRSLVDATSNASLAGLKDLHGFELPNEFHLKLVELRERMVNFEKKSKELRPAKKYGTENEAPPEDFRELSIIPTRDDLFNRKPYVRPNIVNGSYQDVEHYLDVQFRLLREDCFGPLREGMNQFINDQTKKRYDNIRIFRDVKFVKPYISQTKIGSLVQINILANKMFKRTNWAHNKRFIYGSLVLFTKDNCKNFIVATILDREEKYLVQGMIPVIIIGQDMNLNLYNDDKYVMIESEVYFEPYFHVLKVLQDPTFPQHLAMKQYIVDVQPEPRPPSYLEADTKFIFFKTAGLNREIQECDGDSSPNYSPTSPTYAPSSPAYAISSPSMDTDINTAELNRIMDGNVKFTVLQDETWPNEDTLSFNASQYDAYKLSLTHEFAVVQGPPGTGKTYLGIKVAKTLFENLNNKKGCLMLVICYTNHALDQFLEALINITDSIVRIGNQSRNEAMKNISLNTLRPQIRSTASNKAFFEQKMALKDAVRRFEMSLIDLDVLLNGVLRSKIIAESDKVDDSIKHLWEYYKKYYSASMEDPLSHWLFEDGSKFYDVNDLNDLLEEPTVNHDAANHEKENRKRTGVVLDDPHDDNAESKVYRTKITLFSIEELNERITKLITQYKKTQHELEQREIAHQLLTLNSYRKIYYEMSTHRQRRVNIRITKETNFSAISTINRWSLYFSWIYQLTQEARKEVNKLQKEVSTATALYEESRMMLDMEVLRGKKIIGMTTSGAARMRKLLQALNPPIVIVEEAAEVLEQHIITSLTAGCKHLILIGDHQQLRPSASHMRLAKHFGLEVSLFERMIKNGIHSRRLSVQHRMRPEIAALICPHIYPELVNHKSVYDFPDVKGMKKNMFFYTHDFKEEKVEENMSRTNHREADMTLGLANYLMQQGYAAEDVTILAAYKGQMFYMRKKSDQYNHLMNVKITVVDNYQGEESKIILLSLVRNNEDNKIGFLGTENRICVALSRAKEGFYIFGNIDTLKANSDLWRKIATTLESGDSIGAHLTLRCQNHPDNMTIIDKLEDFQKVPEGGCLFPCDSTLPKCGHKCLLMCHGYDNEHLTGYTRCTHMCERILCELLHVCPKKCAEECGPCKRKVLKKLPCEHEMAIFCHLEPDDPKVKCLTIVEVTLPDCKHKAKKPCHMNVKEVRCEVKCEFRVEKCGHSCLRKCHVTDDPEHEKYLCNKQCAKAKLNCKADLIGDRGDHQCLKKCYESCDPCNVQVLKKRTTCKHQLLTNCNVDVDTVMCLKKCSRTLPCGHFCKKLCTEQCGDCRVMVPKPIPGCGHKITLWCKSEPSKENCNAKCERTMKCGHKCKGICGKDCLPSECTEPSLRKVRSPCGHLISLPCNMAELPEAELEAERLMSHCSSACGAQLACGHVCGGDCARCRRGSLHAPCTQKCNQDNICGHQCEEPCNQICPPCKKKCEVRCEHNRCNKTCGAPCTPCEECCSRRCVHGACKNRCGEACSRAVCDEACPRLLECGHACRGLCGEPCPPVCHLCSPDTFPVDFLGEPFEHTDRFVLLQDCGHVMEVENMDNLMMGDRDSVQIRSCPFCRTPIINTSRYKDLVTAIFRNDINPIKERVFGTAENIAATRMKLEADLESYSAKYKSVLEGNMHLREIFLKLKSVVKMQKNVSKLQLDMELVCLDILDMVSECCMSYSKSDAKKLNDEFAKQVRLICSIFGFQIKKRLMFKISQQQRMDVQFEIRRLNAIVQFDKLLSHAFYAVAKSSPAVSDAYKIAHAAVFNPTKFKEDEAIDVLKKLQETIKVSGNVVSKQEREMIVRAMSSAMKAGAWYKCPKGHYYCIGDCGGAVEIAKCPECGSQIGGTSHRLLSSNKHAPEMDNSKYPAWSEAYNNMANFQIID